jgi:hypothetical protein
MPTASARAAEGRAEGRSNVFLTATLDSGGASTTVRIRNLSVHGALLDGPALPPVGTRVRLKRGRLSVAGHLAWEGEGQRGLKFDAEIDVASWVRRVGHSGQERIDGVLASLRSSGNVPPELEDGQQRESLPVISAALDQLCERLATMPGISVEFGEELLRLDSIAQSLRRLATDHS